MSREVLPDRRRSWTQKVKLPDATGQLQTFYLTCGEYPDGRLGEIWIEAHKEGTFARGVLGALARMVSISLQHGVPVRDVIDAMRFLNFPPRGPVVGSDAVKDALSVADWIAQELDAAYGNRRTVTPDDRPRGDTAPSPFDGTYPQRSTEIKIATGGPPNAADPA